MATQQRILKGQDEGRDVTALQTTLHRLDYNIPEDERTASRFGARTMAAVKEFQDDHHLPQTGIVDEETENALSRETRASSHTISGSLTSGSALHRLGGLTVELVDKNVGGDHRLATIKTRSDGSFLIEELIVSPRYLKKRHKTRPDLQAQVSGSAGLLGTSKVHYNAPQKLRLEVVLPPDAKGLPSEYETLRASLSEAYRGRLADLEETAERQDLTYLANKTGWDVRAITFAATAENVSAGTAKPAASANTEPEASATTAKSGKAIKPEFFYALFRAGISTDATSCFMAGPKRVEAIWKQAISDNVIPAGLADEVAAASASYLQISAARSLSAKSPKGVSSLSEMLAGTLLDADQQTAFASIHAQHSEDPATLWAEVSRALGEEKSQQLQFEGKLFHLTRNNAPLVAALKKAEAGQPMTAMRELATRGYYDAAKWKPLIAGSVPPDAAGTSLEEKESSYAGVLAAQIRVAYPTDVIADQVKRGVYAVAGGTKMADAIHSFLTSQNKEFVLGAEPVEAYIARKKILGTSSHVVAQVKRLQRVYQITPDDTSMAVLLRHNLDSASAIVRYDAAGFKRAFAGKLGSEQKATAIHSRAKQVYSTVLNAAVTYLGARAQPTLGGAKSSATGSSTTGPGVSRSNAAGLINPLFNPQADPADAPGAASATLESLFGSLDYCNCDDCGSILSPAAYLVDLLNFIDKPQPSPNSTNPQTVLFSRRPDLQYLPLTCENTNTALPYIDLVNETLEAFVANGLSLAGYQGHDTGDQFSSADLLANPQFVNAAAYSTLKTTYFPAPLPFDRSLELLRQHFASLGVALPDLMIALRINDQWINDTYNGHLPISYGWADITLELLQISWAELNIFTGDDTDIPDIDLGSLYGLPSDGTALATLQSMDLQTFTRRLGISYDDIAAILQTRWVNQDAVLIPLLQQLQMPITNLVDLKSGVLTPDQFTALLPAGIDATKYGGTSPGDLGAIAAWAVGPAVAPQVPVYPRLMDIITIADPSGADPCTGTSLFLRYTNPDPAANLLTQTEYICIAHFVRLWQKLAAFFGTTDDAVAIEQTASIVDAFYPPNCIPQGRSDPANDESNIQLIAQGFAEMLPCASFLAQIMTMLSLNAQDSLPQLLACWSDIQTTGTDSLYTQLFLTPSQLQQDQLGQTATVAGYFTPGEEITLSINGVVLSYTTKLNDLAAAIADNLAAAVNGCTDPDPDTGLPLNVRFNASVNGGIITVEVGFQSICSVSAAATETIGLNPNAQNTPVLQSFNIGGTVTPGDVLTILINGVPVSITAQTGDTTETLLSNFANAFSLSTAQDGYSGAPLNTAVLAAVEDGSLVLTAANIGTPFDLVCSIGAPTVGGYEISGLNPGGVATITLGGTAAAGDTVTVLIVPLGAAGGPNFVYTAVAADAEVNAFAANLAAFLQTSLANYWVANIPGQVTSAANVVTVSWPSFLTYTIAATLSDTTNSTIAAAGSNTPNFTATVLPGLPPDSVITTTWSNIGIVRTFQYLVLPSDTAATIATAIAAGINANVSGMYLAASSQDNVVTVYETQGSILTPTLTGTVSVVGSYAVGTLSPACWTANLTDNYFNYLEGAQVTTIIDGVAVPHVLSGTDIGSDVLPGLVNLCASINSTTAVDSLSGLALNQTVTAYPNPSAPWTSINIVPIDPRTWFTVACSYLPSPSGNGYTYTPGGPYTASQTITVTEPISPGAQLTTTINGIDIVYRIKPSDTAATIASGIVDAINSSTIPDPASGAFLSTMFSASAYGGIITLSAVEFTTPLVLSVSSSIGTITAGRQQTPFADDGYGNLLSDPSQTVMGYEPLLCAACNLTGSEFELIVNALGFDSTTPLTLANVSAVYRFGWLPHTLGISVLEFLELRSCTQLDPFQSLFPGDPPNVIPPAVRFISLVQALAAAGLKPVQALYLMWNDDITGTAAPTQPQIDALAFNLRQDFVAVNAQFALVSDPDGSIAASLMALVYTATATDFFFGLLNNTIQPSVSYAAPPDQSTLPPSLATLSGGLLAYDGLRKQLSFAGLLSDAMASTLQAAPVLIDTSDSSIDALAGPATIFTPASMGNIQAGSEVWVDTGALEELVTVIGVTATTFTAQTLNAHNGTATPVAIVDPLIVAISALAATSNALANPFFAQFPELQPLYAAYEASTASLEDKRTALLANFIPTLRSKRKQEQALAAITAAVGTDASFAISLLNDPQVLQADQDPTSAAIVDLTAIESGGLSLPYAVDSSTGTTWAGAMAVPQDGFYNLSIAVDAGVDLTVSIDGVPIAGVEADGAWTNQTPLAFVAGSPASVELIYSTPVSSVGLSWQTTGIGWQPVPSNYLYPANLLGALQGTYVRFLKAASIAAALSLTANEIATLGRAPDPDIDTTCNVAVAAGQALITPFSMNGIAPGTVLILDSGDSQEIVTVTATTAATFSAVTVWAHDGTSTPFLIRSLTLPGISVPQTSGGWLNLLGPLQITQQFTGELPGQYLNPATQSALRDILLSLLDFSRMKQSLSPGDERLLDVLEDPAATLPNGQTALVSLTGWAIPSINALLTHFFASIQPSSLGTVENFRRVFDAYALVQQCRISSSALIAAVTTAPTANTVSALQSALRALYADSDWQTVIQPINDAMRIKQRDALVAYILQQPFAAENGIYTADDLFAYFLLDTETQPPVQTSRIRLALSSVQLFIERCVRNLETMVASGDIDATQWSWMKRYRIWQANREVFLWPENWLYPELRDDASPFFSTMMSRLLQSDITDDEASNAYLDYLTSLEEVAKLEPCGIYHVPGSSTSDEISYVVARTAGARRKYYFRQLQFGSWTPWTEVQIECEGLPLTPVVWNNRLFLFWLKAVKQQSSPVFAPAPSGDNNSPFASLTPAQSQENAQANVTFQTSNSAITVGGILCWTEFYNNKWQPTKTSDVNRPTTIGAYDPTGGNSFEYAREQLSIVPGIVNQNAQALGVTENLSDALLLTIEQSYNAYSGVRPINSSDPIQNGCGFLLHNTHSRPIRFEDIFLTGTNGEEPIRALLDPPLLCREFSTPSDHSGSAAAGTFEIYYVQNPTVAGPQNLLLDTTVLTYNWAPCFTQPPTPADASPGWTAPFLYEDRKNVFYATVDISGPETQVTGVTGFGVSQNAVRSMPMSPLLRTSAPGIQSGIAPVLSNKSNVTFKGVQVAATGTVSAPVTRKLK